MTTEEPPGSGWTVDTLHEHHAALRKADAILANERDRRYQERYEVSERQRVELKEDTTKAVAAALTAQKEAVAEQTASSKESISKSEDVTSGRIAEQARTFTTALEGQRRDIDDLKLQGGGMAHQGAGRREATTDLYRAAAFVLSLVTIASLIYAATGR